jgi:redox-sensitive bicupin YhaK (pirin superfamily)
MIHLRPSAERGRSNLGWLDSRHTFSFADYYDPQFMGFSDLRVINDDRVAGGAGFGTHGHRDMEIISYVLEGSLEHRDDAGGRGRLNAGEVQTMSAGRGVMHSEYNGSASEAVAFLQIWILPERSGGEPAYAQKDFSASRGITLVVSPDGRDGSLSIRQNALLYRIKLGGRIKLDGESASLRVASDRVQYLHLARGSMSVNGIALAAGDGAYISDEETLSFDSETEAEAVLIDLRAR